MTIAISAIIPAYNAMATLRESIESLQAQSLPAAEIIVVDDGSTDETAIIARSYPDVTLVQQENRGLARARLAGYRAANYDYLYFIDADDLAAPDALARLAAGFNAVPEAITCYGTAQMVSADLQPLESDAPRHKPSGQLLRRQLHSNLLPVGTALIRKAALREEVMDLHLPIGEDQVMWAQLTALGPFYYVGGTALLRCRKHDDSLSRKQINDAQRYFAYVDWIFSYPPVLAQLDANEAARLKRRRTAATHGFIAKTALSQRQRRLARLHALGAVWHDPFNIKLWALAGIAIIGILPAFIERKLYA